MRGTGIARGLAAAIVAAGLLFGGPAQSTDVCDEATKTALTEAFKQMGVPGVDPTTITVDAWLEYVKNPTEKKLDAAMNSLGEGAASLVFPAYGVALKGGRIVVDGVSYTIEQAKSQQLEAYLCGTSSFGEAFTQIDFWSLKAVQEKSKGINCNNFAERVRTLQDLAAFEAIWKGYYARQLIEFAGPQNRDEITRVLSAGWTTLERDWKLRWAAVVFANLRAELERQAKALAARKACDATEAKGAAAAEFVWNRTPDAYTVIGSKGTLSGSLQNWHFVGPATLNGKELGADVTCDGQLTAPKPEPGAAGKMKCDITWGTPQSVWHCEGPGVIGVVWSLGDFWFGVWPQSCEGSVVENGKAQTNKFGLMGLKSGLGLK